MTPDVKYCFEDEDLDQVVRDMGEQRVRRLPVLHREKRLVGVVARAEPDAGAEAAAGVSQPGGPHRQKPPTSVKGAKR